MTLNIQGLDTLVFSGGGVRGVSYAGALMAFKDTYGLSACQHFKTFAGASVGALFALVCVLGLEPDAALGLLNADGLGAIFHSDPSWLLTQFALNSGENLEALVNAIMTLGGLPPDATFETLWQARQKTLVVTVVDLLTGNVMYLDHTNEGRTLPVKRAIMGSMALPPLFPPVKAKLGDLKLYLFADGGLLDNFPVSKFPEERTLGIRSKWYIDPTNPMTDISTYYTRVLSILQLTMHSIQQQISSTHPHLILIDLGPMSAHNISVEPKDLVFAGYRAAVAKFTAGPGPAAAHGAVAENAVKFLGDGVLRLPAYIDAWYKANK